MNQTATSALGSLLERDPANPKLVGEVADDLFRDASYREAAELLCSVPAEIRSLPEIRVRVARSALARGRFHEAISEYEALRSEGVQASWLEHDRAHALFCIRDSDAAMKLVSEALERFGESTDLLVLKARIHMATDELEKAIACVEAALTRDPGNPTTLGVKSIAMLDSNRLADARADAVAALSRDANQHEALVTVATIFRWEGELESAERLHERILRRYPASGRTLFGSGEIALARADFARAEELLSAAARIMPRHVGTLHALAWAQLLQGNLDAAELSYRRAREAERNFGDSHGGLALVATLRGDEEQAEQHLSIALRLDPTAITAMLAKALLESARGDTGRAERMFAAILAKAGIPGGPSLKLIAQRLSSAYASRRKD
ncbi:tetratricopeptide repeat protein [Arenimonas terrae]|uniref:Tetratricopeptide repeat protein n=1 Tax=Arenimonas terrae TaxID=2546226 RepID=A0A5C4RQB2_9GAMM|nr:tetratricopeptide repeat protein [Arenimonas terrae]TNJ33248.1 tetratricopeptide repeat protein [Arenimonas terrae]